MMLLYSSRSHVWSGVPRPCDLTTKLAEKQQNRHSTARCTTMLIRYITEKHDPKNGFEQQWYGYGPEK